MNRTDRFEILNNELAEIASLLKGMEECVVVPSVLIDMTISKSGRLINTLQLLKSELAQAYVADKALADDTFEDQKDHRPVSVDDCQFGELLVEDLELADVMIQLPEFPGEESTTTEVEEDMARGYEEESDESETSETSEVSETSDAQKDLETFEASENEETETGHVEADEQTIADRQEEAADVRPTEEKPAGEPVSKEEEPARVVKRKVVFEGVPGFGSLYGRFQIVSKKHNQEETAEQTSEPVEEEIVAETPVEDMGQRPMESLEREPVEDVACEEVNFEDEEVLISETTSAPTPEEDPQEPEVEEVTHPEMKQVEFTRPGTNFVSVDSSRPRADIRRFLSLNDRFLFLRELFRGDVGMMNYLFDQINLMDSDRQALDFIQKEFDWNEDRPGYAELKVLIDRHFKKRFF